MIWLGIKDYVESIKLQNKIIDRCTLISSFAESETRKAEEVIGLEHPLTITLGKRADPFKDFKVSVKVLREKKVNVVSVDRGGQATLHNPGQLVIYPVINIRQRGIRVRDYVHLLEDVTKRFLSDYGIVACRRGDQPGLYTVSGKIAFFGVRIKNGMTSHGLAINVYNNLSNFSFIRSCGKDQDTFSKMQEYCVDDTLETLFVRWHSYFQTGLSLTQDVNRPIVENPLNMRV